MPNRSKSANTSNQDGMALSLGISFGTAAATILGAITGDWGIWLPIGIGVGTALGIAFGATRAKG